VGPDGVDPFLHRRHLDEGLVRETGCEVLGGGAHQVPPGREVAVDSAMGQADSVSHLLNREASTSPFKKKADGGVEDCVACGFGVAAAGGQDAHVISMSRMSRL